MPEAALIDSVQIAYRHLRPTRNDILEILSSLEAERFLSATTESFSQERVWLLTAKGEATLKASIA